MPNRMAQLAWEVQQPTLKRSSLVARLSGARTATDYICMALSSWPVGRAPKLPFT